MEGHTLGHLSPLEGHLLPTGELTFDVVQDRLVEAMVTCWRQSDRERAWLHVRSAWPEIARETSAGDYDARGGDASSSQVSLRPASLTRVDIAEMEQAFTWVKNLPEDDRKVLALAITQLASGKREIGWRQIMTKMGVARGADGIRMRYRRAIAAICDAQNGRNARGSRVNADNQQA